MGQDLVSYPSNSLSASASITPPEKKSFTFIKDDISLSRSSEENKEETFNEPLGDLSPKNKQKSEELKKRPSIVKRKLSKKD